MLNEIYNKLCWLVGGFMMLILNMFCFLLGDTVIISSIGMFFALLWIVCDCMTLKILIKSEKTRRSPTRRWRW